MRHMAVLDLGTNSTMLLLCRASPAGNLREVREELRMPRLGQGVADTGRLSAAAIDRTLAAAAELLASLPGRGRGLTVATSAVRDAENRDPFLDAFAVRFGHRPLLLAGEQEAAAIFRGAAHDQQTEAETLIDIDIGGGSTELTIGDRRNGCRLACSLDLGCVRCGERFGLLDAAAPSSLSRLRCEVRKLVEPVAAGFRELTADSPWRVLASGGTAAAFAVYQQGLRGFSRSLVHGYRARECEVAAGAMRLAAMPLAERTGLPSVESGRAAVLPAGLLILSEILRVLEVSGCTVTTRGLRFGLALRLRRGELAANFSW